MQVAILPHDIIPGDIEANLAAAGQRLDSEIEPSTDIVVLPELFNSGFRADAAFVRAAAEPADGGRTLAWLRGKAREGGYAIAGSFTVEDGGNLFNRAFFVEPDGVATFYDKHHLFLLGGEAELYTAGSSPIPVIDYHGWRFSLAVCYDLRFPTWLRNRGLAYDCLIVPASWPEARAYAWHHLLAVRALENQAYVVGANRTGSDPYGEYPITGVAVYDHWGRPVSTAADGKGPVTALLDAAKLERDRQRFPVWADAD